MASEAGAAAAAEAAKGREKTRLTRESGARVDTAAPGTIGGAFESREDPVFLAQRAAVYDEIIAAQKERLARKPRVPIRVTLPDGKVVEGISWQTTPLEIAEGISKGLAGSVVVAKVAYSSRVGVEEADGLGVVNTGPEEEEEAPTPAFLANGGAPGAAAAGAAPAAPAELWDLTRPLEGDCTLSLLKFEDKEGRMVFWHSSAHVLGECLECKYGAKLCIGPPTEEGFYYDAYMGDRSIHEADYPVIKAKAEVITKAKQPFERIVLSKEQALRLFADNPFKVQLIATKIPDGGYTTAYRCGPLIDLCRGPHVPTTAAIKAFEVTKNSSAYWLGNVDNDSLQRVYGVSFPDAKALKAHLAMLEEAKKRDHRLLGAKQELFFFHELSPGSAFFLPHGTRIYNRLMDHIRTQYRVRGYQEVVTPNIFNIDLWRISGHADHYLDNMFTFKVEGADYALKPMNCPGHCLMFDHRVRSHRELPLRLADFGVLHRNEFSGALTGLTRVRRFQQDDAHIFARLDQVEAEVAGALDFMQHTYGIFGFTFELDLSTRPKKALGSLEQWAFAEKAMAGALDRFCAEQTERTGKRLGWKLNPGDGAFYGPKIDIKVFDALGRRHQCATIQLDFQLPIRFNLRYRSGAAHAAAAAAGGEGEESAVAAAAPAAVAEAPAAAEGEAPAGEAPVGGEGAAPAAAGGKKGKEGKAKKEKKAAGASAASEGSAAAGGGGGAEGADAEAAAPSGKAQSTSAVAAMVERARSGVDELPEGFERPVIIHRAILGSVERFMAVLIEHTGGKWPFWLSPRQVAIVPVIAKYLPYAHKVAAALHAEGFHVEVDASSHTLPKKVREAQVAQYNFILVVGEAEEAAEAVAVRTRDDAKAVVMPLAEFVAHTRGLVREYK